MLDNKVYLGHLEYGKRINLSYKSKKVKYMPRDEWKIVNNTHEPIISQDLFDIVQNMRRIDKNIKRIKHDWELKGLVKCKECGARMTLKVEYKRNNKNELKSKKICCLNGLKRYKGRECIKGSKGLDENELNTIVYDNLKTTVSKIINEKKIKDLIREQNYEQAFKNIENNKEKLVKELEKTEEEIRTLYLDYRNEILDEEDYKKFYEEKANQKNRLKKEIEILDKEKETKPVLSEEKLNELVLEIMNMKGIKKDIISEIIYDIQIDNDNNIYINYKYDIFNVA